MKSFLKSPFVLLLAAIIVLMFIVNPNKVPSKGNAFSSLWACGFENGGNVWCALLLIASVALFLYALAGFAKYFWDKRKGKSKYHN